MSVSSASIRSVSQAATIGGTKQKLKVPPHKAILCRTCNELFDDEASLIKHKLWAMQIRGTHAHCTVCAMEFRTMDAQKQHMIEVSPTVPGPARKDQQHFSYGRCRGHQELHVVEVPTNVKP